VRIILKWILDRMVGMEWIHVAQDRDRWREGSCEHGNELSGYKEILEYLHSWQFLRKGSAL
jgi:hypothetical protein